LKDFTDNEVKTKTWRDVQDEFCIPQYQTGSITERPANSSQISFTIGTGSNCDSLTSYCNGALKAGTRYAVVLRIYTATGFLDKSYITIKTEQEIQLFTILISILLVLFAAFVVGFIITYRRTKALK